MEMKGAEDFGGHKIGNKSCVYCSDSEGNLKPKNVVREGMIRFWMQRENLDRLKAEEKTDKHMRSMPAWKK
jgi:hypothetical protein